MLAQFNVALSAALQDELEVEIHLVDRLEPEPNGKFRPYRCLVNAKQASRA
jgi:hypothetical protein